MGSIAAYETSAGRRYRVRYRTPDRRQTDKRGFRTKRDAEDFLATVEVSKIRGEWVDPTRARITIAEWAPQWYAAQLQLKATTLSGYRLSLDRHVVPRWGNYRLADVGHADVQSWVTELSQTLAASTVRQIFLVLSGLMKYAIRDGRMNRNPCDGVRLPRAKAKARGYLTHEQVGALARACGQEYGDIVLFLAYTGLRWGEMAALKVGRLDMLRRRMEVAEGVTAPRGELVWSTPKSHASRSVPFPAFLTSAIAARCVGRRRDELVFVGPDGGVLRSNNFRRRQFADAVAACKGVDADFPSLTLHDLRHTAASLAISAGANVKAVQRMLGHASAAMTLDVYADLFDDDLDSVATALDSRAAAAGVTAVL
ncbi:tyrosine-type recombinase/integrase [Schumannella soli]|uniref:Site-specific integrase n=1 Tax=Schumannella soli TaxID=2590779 RepID=A0A506XWL5_9MICO|nr:tyrosine-type recombinase/integrase [Schumannella soli]TPW74205.1 site-specific integrase [Schumannella soli]